MDDQSSARVVRSINMLKGLLCDVDAARDDSNMINDLLLFQALKLLYHRAAEGSDAVPKLWSTCGKAGLFRHLAHVMVKVEQRVMLMYREANLGTEEMVKDGRNIPCFRGILDAQGFSLRHATCTKNIQFALELCKLFLNYFPCLGSKWTIVNANRPYEILLSVVRPLFENRGVELRVYGQNQMDWDSEFLDLIDLQTFRKIQEREKALDGRISI